MFSIFWLAITGAKPPFSERYPVYVLVEILGVSEEDDQSRLEQVLERSLEQELICDVIVAQSIDHAQRLWKYREAVGELLAALKPHAAFDVGIPTSTMAAFVQDVRAELTRRFPTQRHLFSATSAMATCMFYPAPIRLPSICMR